MKAGKIRRRVRVGILAGGLILPLFVAKAVNEAIHIKVTIENPQPTCRIDVSGGNTQNLGVIERQRQFHEPFTIGINCDGNVKTRIKAATSDKVDSSGLSIHVKMNGVSGSPEPKLRLQADGRYVQLRDSDNDWFCTANIPSKKQTCSVTPVTEANKRVAAGAGSATVTFTIDYLL